MSEKFWAYIGTKPECGCNVAIIVDDPKYKNDVASQVAEFLRDGLTVNRIEVEFGGVPVRRCSHKGQPDA